MLTSSGRCHGSLSSLSVGALTDLLRLPPCLRLEMRYVDGKGLLARSGDIELSPEGLPEVLQDMPIHMR